MLVGGLFLNIEDIPVYFIWLQYISVFFYANMVAIFNQFDGVQFTCGPGDLQGGVCPLSSGSDVIERYSFDSYAIWVGFLGMGVTFVIFRVLIYLAMELVVRTKSAV